MRAVNGNIMLKVNTELEELGNGLSISAQMNERRKIIHGEAVFSGHEDVQVGDTVHFPFFAADLIYIKGEKYYVLNYKDVKFIEEDINEG